MKNELEILEVIGDNIDLNNFKTHIGGDIWWETHKKINDELIRRNLIGKYQNLFFTFGIYRIIDEIRLQLETRCIKEEDEERYLDSDGDEVVIRRRCLEDIEEKEQDRFNFSPKEWMGFKRTKTIDRMLNEK